MKTFLSKKTPFLGLLLAVFLLAVLGSAVLANSTEDYTDSTVELTNTVQTITIKAGLGYSPSRITAKASTPTQLKLETDNTYDCTAFVNIPKLGVKQYLPPTGSTFISIPEQNAGDEIVGYCGADTYKFVIKFS